MKKIMLFSAFATILSIAFMSCKKDKTPESVTYPVESGGVTTLLVGKDIHTIKDPYELGVAFKTAVKGKIKSLKINLPATGKYYVTLWKVSDQSVVITKTINCDNINSWNNSIDVAIAIDANTEYILSTNTYLYYRFSHAAGLFPMSKGNVTLLGYRAHYGDKQEFPNEVYTTLAFGFVDFTFQQTL